MRAVLHCNTCDFRLPYCVRTDRRFCQERCRVWWYWHPGRKRPDFSPGGWGLPKHPGKGQPKTLAAALQALAEARKHAAALEAAARAMQLVDHHLRSKLTELRAEAITSRRELMKELETLQDELDEARAQLARVEEPQEVKALRDQGTSLTARLKESEGEVAKLRAALEEKEGALSKLRSLHEKQAEQHAEEVRKLQAQVATGTALRDHLNRQHAEMARTRNEAVGRLEKLEHEATERQTVLERASAELSAVRATHEQAVSAVRATHEQAVAQHAQEVGTLKAQAASLVDLRDDLKRQNAELTRSRDEAVARAATAQAETATAQAEIVAVRRSFERATADITAQRQRAETAEQLAAQRDEDLRRQQHDFTASEKAHREIHLVAESESRSLRAEKERRVAAEQRVAQLVLDLEALAREDRSVATADPPLDLDKQLALLLAENREVRTHRDEIDAEREHLSARLLHWMSPGQYLEHAAAGGYEPDRDPLIKLKREEILVEHRYFAWQEAHHKDRRARALDPEQTLVEQAYATAMSARWSLIHKPHRKLKKGLKWIVIGFQVDLDGEAHLQALVRGRIARMEQNMQKAF